MIDLSFLKGNTVGVVGLGKTGQATVDALEASGIAYKTWDDKVNDISKKEDFLKKLDLIIWSPGIDFNKHEVAQKAISQNIEIICDLELLYRACPNATYLGITGTNGKSTTVTLMQFILERSGIKSQLGGNIGNAALSLEMLDETGIYVLELSSYQIELIKNMQFAAGGLLNLNSDHLDRHGSMENYANIKKKLLDNSKIKVISIDDSYCEEIANTMNDKITISVNGKDANIVVKNDKLKDFDLTIMPVNDLMHLKGKHNYQNLAFAYTILRNATKISVDNIILGILNFPGIKHRQQLIREVNGVAYINDSKATNCDATEQALRTYENIHWIVGGRSKPGGFQSLSPYLNRIKKAYIIGECENELVDFFNNNNFTNYEICKTLKNSMKSIKSNVEKGDIVLLSPACASWDQFESFEHRGDEFIKLCSDLN